MDVIISSRLVYFMHYNLLGVTNFAKGQPNIKNTTMFLLPDAYKMSKLLFLKLVSDYFTFATVF